MSEPDDPHEWSELEWRTIVDLAEGEAERIGAGFLSSLAPPPSRGYGTGVAVHLDGVVVAARHGGPRGMPTFGVLHSAETPLAPGYAAAIARMFATTTAAKSCHYMTDPRETWGVLDDGLTAWHCGTGNTRSIGLEQAGRASMTREQWLGDAGSAQLERNAAIMRGARDRYGIRLAWMGDDELRRAHAGATVGGWATHDQCRRVLGGTTHTDPGGGFPGDVQMRLAIEGADDVALTQQDIAAVSDAIANRGLGAYGAAWQTWNAAAANAEKAAKAIAALTPAAISAAVVKALPASGGGAGVSTAELEAAVETAVRRVLADAGTP